MPSNLNEREYRVINVQDIEARAEDDGAMIVEGYATTFNRRYVLYDFGDYAVDEEIAPEAFNETDMTDVIMQYDHQGRVFARNKNGTLELHVDEKGLRIRARLDGTDIGRQLYQEIKGGYTDKMSFGFTVSTDERTEEEDHEHNRLLVHRRITGIKKLYDVSAVSLPANDTTEISARRFCDGVIADIKAERLAALQRARQKQKIRLMMEVTK